MIAGMNGWDWEELTRKIRAEVRQRYREGLTRQEVPTSLWTPVTLQAYQEAKRLEKVLLRECAGRSLLDLYPGTVRRTEYGEVLLLEEERGFPSFVPEKEVGEAWVLRTLRLLYGVGEATEMRLKRAGYSTLRDLLHHPRWAWQVERILQALERRDLPSLLNLVARWFPVSHPIALALLGFVEPEKLLFLDIETLGLSTEPLILIGLVRLQDGGVFCEAHRGADDPGGASGPGGPGRGA
jgi:hypothetical protein